VPLIEFLYMKNSIVGKGIFAIFKIYHYHP
jgi:hypothetical protein